MTNNDQLYEQIKDLLEANLTPIKKDITSINKSLNGNGQPGLFQRVEVLEKNKAYALGGWKLMGIIAAGFFAIADLVARLWITH